MTTRSSKKHVADRHVLSGTHQFFDHEGSPVWALLVSYRDPERPAALKPTLTKKGKPDWRAMLSEPERPAFDALRDWRNALWQ